MADHASSSSECKGSFVATLLAAIGGFAIFLLILVVAYLPNKKPMPVGDGVKTPEQRKAALAELRGKGVVRVPLDRAIELTIQEHQKK